MGDNKVFGDVADPLKVTLYDQRRHAGHADMTMEDIIDWAEEAGIDLRITRCDDLVQVSCTRLEDAAEVREIAKGYFQSDDHAYIKQFTDETPAWRNAWVYSARDILQRAGIKHTVEDASGHPAFVFEAPEAALAFRGLVDNGIVDRHTEARIKAEGPAAPGAVPY